MSEHARWRQDKIHDGLYYITGMNDDNLPELFATTLTEKRANEIVDAVNNYTTIKAQCDELLAVLNEIGGYTGEGRINSPWQEIVKSIGELARAAIANAKKDKP